MRPFLLVTVLSTAFLVQELIAHSVPTLDFGPNYDLPSANETAYNLGTWALTLRYRESTNQWFWIGCANVWTTYVYAAPAVTGSWEQATSFQPCFYDCGLLVDDDDTLYVAYGSNSVSVAQLFPAECASIEGNRMYKINGSYYILDDGPSDGIAEVWKASDPFGPYERRILVDSSTMSSPVPGTGVPIQGSLAEVKKTGEWYFMSFAWNYPLGRVPVLAPITWGEDGFPVLGTAVPSWMGVDYFEGEVLVPAWQWNHNLDTTRFTLNSPGLPRTVTVTDDLYAARNTLTHRIHGARPYGVVELDFSNMTDGDHCGLAALKDASAWIGVVRNGRDYHLAAVQDLMMGQYGGMTSTGTIVARAPITATKVSYSLDGTEFTDLGYRYGIFNYATKALGESVEVISFTSEATR
ncbi:glycosyl hydrolase [Aspergillus alliaceus]|uniref:Glycosyl hydrolase n=1 Tax=Petromyces alliaceus TaxID=209559 RepID=A0A5N7BQ96_PETAA|nr:glycosyl hydrolase [Aspergillus alliaceus]